MTPKEKADELVNKMWIYAIPNADGSWGNAKKCALIAVDEILELLEDNGLLIAEYHDKYTMEYWLEVKQEIEKL